MSRTFAFLIKSYDNESKYYNANVKPFVDLSKGLTGLGYNVLILLDETEKQLEGKITSILTDKVKIIYYNSNNMSDIIIKNNVNYLMVEDNMKIMRTAIKFKKSGIKIIVYVQYLYGVNTNNPDKRRRSFPLFIGSNLPWRFVTRTYRKLVSSFDFIIPNSHACEYILRHFYNIKVSGVVYPPVGTDMRTYVDKFQSTEKEGLLIFAGNLDNDYYYRDLKFEISNLKAKLNIKIRVFVSNPNSAKYFSDDNIEVLYNLSAEELSKLYSESKVTYVPTIYELFGYVGAESLMFKTPVILDTYHPFMESIPAESNAVIISKVNKTLLETLLEVSNADRDILSAQASVLHNYSPSKSAGALDRILDE